jgi:hypothetical protein
VKCDFRVRAYHTVIAEESQIAHPLFKEALRIGFRDCGHAVRSSGMGRVAVVN